MTDESKQGKAATNKFELKHLIASICDDDSDDEDIELLSDSDELQEILVNLTSECLSNNLYKSVVSNATADFKTRHKQIATFHLNKEIFVNINESLFDELISQLQQSKLFQNVRGNTQFCLF